MHRSLAGNLPRRVRDVEHEARHDPKVSQRNDGSWIVNCSECLRSPDDERPIGIGIALSSRLTAERLKENHTSRPLPPKK
jgi:hypothetical protein